MFIEVSNSRASKRFRLDSLAMMSDIESAFHKIVIVYKYTGGQRENLRTHL